MTSRATLIRKLAPALMAGSAIWLASSAQAAVIQTTQITPSTTMGQYLGFSINQIVDGNSSETPLNGYASGLGVVSGRITLTLDQSYDLASFTLWNDINVLNEGVRSFTLTFEDAAGGSLGITPTYTAISLLAPQIYTFANTVQAVKRVQFDVLTASLQIEIREVAFNGAVTAVPEPSSVAMLLAGLTGLGGWLRTRRR